MLIFSWSSPDFVTYKKKFEDFVNEEFLHKMLNNKDVYADYGATKNISEDAYS